MFLFFVFVVFVRSTDLILCRKQTITILNYSIDFSNFILTVSQKCDLGLSSVYDAHGMGFVPNSNKKEIVLFGSFSSNFESSLVWLSVLGNNYEKIQVNKEKTEIFSIFVDKNIANTQFHDFGYTIYKNYLIIFGGDSTKDSKHNEIDDIFYFDFTLNRWFQSTCVKYIIVCLII